MSNETVLTDEHISEVFLKFCDAENAEFSDVARAIEQAVLRQQAKPDSIKRAESYGEGYADGWNAALKQAASLAQAFSDEHMTQARGGDQSGASDHKACAAVEIADAIRAAMEKQP